MRSCWIVQYTMIGDDNDEICCYGRLDFIFDFELPHIPTLETVATIRKPTHYLLAGITGCKTNGKDATLERVTYTKMDSAPRVVDLRAIAAVIGRVPISRAKPPSIGIIDRSKQQARTQFVEDFTFPTRQNA